MFIVCRWLAVGGGDGPAVIPKLNAGFTSIDHRLNGYDHSLLKLHTRAATALIRHFGTLVQFQSHTMANQLFYHAESIVFGMLLHRVTYIAYTHTGHCFLNTQIQAFFGNPH